MTLRIYAAIIAAALLNSAPALALKCDIPAPELELSAYVEAAVQYDCPNFPAYAPQFRPVEPIRSLYKRLGKMPTPECDPIVRSEYQRIAGLRDNGSLCREAQKRRDAAYGITRKGGK